MAGLVCGNCGATNPAGSRFCSSCDEFLDWESEPEAADTARPAPRPTPQATPQPTSQPRTPPPADPFPEPAPRPRPTPEARPEPAGTGYQQTTPLATAPDAGVLYCSHCGTGNPPGRRFCRRCGQWVVEPGPPVEVAPTGWRSGMGSPWWRRPFDKKPAYTTPLTTTTVVFRAVGALVAVTVVALLLGVAGFNPIGRGKDYVQHLLGSGRVEGVKAAADPETLVDEHPPDWAVDDVRARAWTTTFVAASPEGPEDACADPVEPAVSNTLVLSLAGPTNVREIGVEGGLPEADGRDKRVRPRTLRLDWAGGGCQSIALKDEEGLQRFAVRQKGDVTGVRITVVGGYPSTNAGDIGSDRLDLGEITFWQR